MSADELVTPRADRFDRPSQARRTFRAIYPKLDASPDFGFFRVAGSGLGNCLYSYFHAYILSLETGAPLIHPAWPSLKLGPLLRSERSKRFYIGLFAAPPGEIAGWRKLWLVLKGRLGAKEVVTINSQCEVAATGSIATSRCLGFGFEHFQPWRAQIRARFIAMLRQKPARAVRWGSGDHIGVHVRLGDFAVAQPGQLESGAVNNLRIPLDWYVAAIERLIDQFPGYPVHIFSDGGEADLARLLAIPGVTLRREPDDISDLIAMAESRILVGSHSTFSRWAVFLGDMPSIWLKAAKTPEKPSGADTPLLLAGDDVSVITASALQAG